MESGSIYRDYSAMCVEFREGMQFLEDNDFASALEAFARADIKTPKGDVYKNKYRSYHGMLLLRTGHLNGMDMCRQAAKAERHDGDVFLNLAQAELKRGNRRAAVAAMHRGLELEHNHPDLNKMRTAIGFRRKSAIPFLSRDNVLNKFIGRLTYKAPGKA